MLKKITSFGQPTSLIARGRASAILPKVMHTRPLISTTGYTCLLAYFAMVLSYRHLIATVYRALQTSAVSGIGQRVRTTKETSFIHGDPQPGTRQRQR